MTQLRHSIVTGQSLAIGGSGGTPVSTDPQTNTHLHRIDTDGSLDPLDNTGRTTQYPDRSLGETAWQAGDPFDLTINTNGAGGASYTEIKKGTGTYNGAIAKVTAGFGAAPGRGDSFFVDALHIIHGERDEQIGTTQAAYLGFLHEWRDDYNADAKAITGQPNDLEVFLCQLGSSSVNPESLAQLQAHREQVGITLVTPKYHLPYVDPSNLHLTAAGYHYLGQYHGAVHRTVAIVGDGWEPLAPMLVTRVGAVVDVKFVVPVAPIVFDTTTVAAQTNMGFSYFDSGVSVAISSVAIVGTDTVRLTLAATPAGTGVVTYGSIGSRGLGNLRDSAPTVSALDATPLRNWCCQFSDPVGLSYTPRGAGGEPSESATMVLRSGGQTLAATPWLRSGGNTSRVQLS